MIIDFDIMILLILIQCTACPLMTIKKRQNLNKLRTNFGKSYYQYNSSETRLGVTVYYTVNHGQVIIKLF